MTDEQDDVIKFDIDVVCGKKPILKEKMSILMTDEQMRKFDDLSIKLMIERGYYCPSCMVERNKAARRY